MAKDKYKKSIESFDKLIAEHREKQKMARNPELFHYYEKEILKFEREKAKKKENGMIKCKTINLNVF